MPKFFVSNGQIKNETNIEINGTDVNHIINVLRKKTQDQIIICDKEKGQDYLCEIVQIGEKINCKIIEKLENDVESNIEVTIYQGLPKGDKMELIIQKSVELGVSEITPIKMKRCVVKLDGKDASKKVQRWQKIAEVAAKQSGRNIVPQINDIKTIKQISNEFENYDLVLIAYENEKQNTLKEQLKKIKENNQENLRIAVVIGTEGGIDESEIEEFEKANAKIITLGKRILRTETVALSVLSIIMYELENMKGI